MHRRNMVAIAGMVFSLFSVPSGWAQGRSAASPAAPPTIHFSLFCLATAGDRTTAYFSDVFDGAVTSLANAGPAFAQYLAGKYSYKGNAVCTGGTTPEQAKTLHDQEVIAAGKRVANVIQTPWVFDPAAAPAKPAVAVANARPAPPAAAPAPVAAPVPAPAAPAAAVAAGTRTPVPSPAPAVTPAVPAVAANKRPPVTLSPAPAAAATAAPAVPTGSTTIYAYCISDESKPVVYMSDVFNTSMGNQTADSTAFLNLMATAYNFSDYLKSKYQYSYAKTTDEPGATCLRHGDAALIQQDRQKWQAAQQAAKKQIVAATWQFTPDSMKLTSAPAPSAPSQSALPTGPGVLTWKQTVQKDQLTDETWTETAAVTAIGKAAAPAMPAMLKVTTKCTNAGLRFVLSVSDSIHSPANPPFGWAKNDTGDNYIPMRVRIDTSAAHQTIAFADSDGDGATKTQYINAPVLLFYDARGIENDANNAIPLTGLGAFDGLIGALTRDASKASAQQMENDAAGSLVQLVNATSIRVELPLVDGQNPIVDLNPRDKVLQPEIQKCVSKLK